MNPKIVWPMQSVEIYKRPSANYLQKNAKMVTKNPHNWKSA